MYRTVSSQPHIGNGMVGGATRPGGDEGGAPAGDARDASGVDGLGQGHVGEGGGESGANVEFPAPKIPRSKAVWSNPRIPFRPPTASRHATSALSNPLSRRRMITAVSSHSEALPSLWEE